MAEKNMNAKINVEFEETANRQQLSSGDNLPTLFGKIKKFFTDLKAVCFSGSYNDLSDKPTTATKDTDGLMSAEDKSKLDNADNTYALKSLYGDTTINVGRHPNTNVGGYSTAEGYYTTARGDYSHAEGYYTIANERFSHAEGNNTTTSGRSSHAEGFITTASGDYSHAEGNNTTASGISSHAGGSYTKALHDNEAAYGKYNESNDNTLFSIGDGTADNARHNAFEITTTGGKLHDKNIAVDISNPNLLINPDFKINQRGATSGSAITQSQGYIVDRWRIMDGDYSVNTNSITLNGTLVQTLEHSIGSDFTASVFTSSGTATAAYDDSTREFTIVSSGAVITGAKLETGSDATPFVTPDPVEELRKCQRYYRIITNTIIQPYLYHTNLLSYFIPIKDMRDNVTPTVEISGTVNDFSGIVIYSFNGGTKFGDIDHFNQYFEIGSGVYLHAYTVFNPTGLSGTLRIADGAKITIDAEIY